MYRNAFVILHVSQVGRWPGGLPDQATLGIHHALALHNVLDMAAQPNLGAPLTLEPRKQRLKRDLKNNKAIFTEPDRVSLTRSS